MKTDRLIGMSHSAMEKGISFCGDCKEFPSKLLNDYLCDKEHGDNPPGARMENGDPASGEEITAG